MNTEEFMYYLFSDGDYNFLWIFVVIIFEIIGFLMIKNVKETEMESTRRLYLGFAVFTVLYGLSRIFFIFANYYYEYGMESSGAFIIHTRLAYILGLSAMLFFIYGLERFFVPTKGLVSLLALVILILVIILPEAQFRILNYFTMPIYIITIVSLYSYVVRKSTGEIRKRAIQSAANIIIMFVGVFLDSRMFKAMFTDWGIRWVVFLFPPFIIMGGLISLYRTNFRQE